MYTRDAWLLCPAAARPSLSPAVGAVGNMAVAGAALAAFALASVAASAVSVNNNRTTLYDLTAVALDGSHVSLASLRGNVSLVINVATF